MSDGNWQQVVEDYKFAKTQNWGKDFLWMEKLVLYLLENRDLSMLYPITSHYRLITYIGDRFEGISFLPQISIELNDHIRYPRTPYTIYRFSLNTADYDNFFKEYSESVYCSFEKSLGVFDEMFEKLKAATETIPTVSRKDENNRR